MVGSPSIKVAFWILWALVAILLMVWIAIKTSREFFSEDGLKQKYSPLNGIQDVNNNTEIFDNKLNYLAQNEMEADQLNCSTNASCIEKYRTYHKENDKDIRRVREPDPVAEYLHNTSKLESTVGSLKSEFMDTFNPFKNFKLFKQARNAFANITETQFASMSKDGRMSMKNIFKDLMVKGLGQDDLEQDIKLSKEFGLDDPSIIDHEKIVDGAIIQKRENALYEVAKYFGIKHPLEITSFEQLKLTPDQQKELISNCKFKSLYEMAHLKTTQEQFIETIKENLKRMNDSTDNSASEKLKNIIKKKYPVLEKQDIDLTTIQDLTQLKESVKFIEKIETYCGLDTLKDTTCKSFFQKFKTEIQTFTDGIQKQVQERAAKNKDENWKTMKKSWKDPFDLTELFSEMGTNLLKSKSGRSGSSGINPLSLLLPHL